MKKALVILGAPGTGKSTIGKQLAEIIDCKYISTGDIARKLADEGGDYLWRLIGDLAPEKELREKFLEEIDGENRVIIDGMPRTTEQVGFLMEHFDKIHVIHLVADDSILIDRLINRNREDDTKVIVRKRLRNYHKTIEDILDDIMLSSSYGGVFDFVDTIDVGKRSISGVIDTIIARGVIDLMQ